MTRQQPTVTDPHHAGGPHTLRDRVLHEIRVYLLITLYFWVFLAAFALYRWITFSSRGIGVEQQGLAIVNALILAKVTMVVEAVYSRRQQHDRPLILPVMKHSALLTLILIAFHGIEGAIHGLIVHGAVGNPFGDIGGGTPIGILSIAILFFTMLSPFCAIQELSRVLGGSTLRRIFFAGRHGMTVRVEFGTPRS